MDDELLKQNSPLLIKNRNRLRHALLFYPMILETTYTNKETIRQINLLTGKPYSFRERWRMGGIGSKRMVISSISKEYEEYLNPSHYRTYANIELRPNGILLHFRLKLEAYAWVMPYAHLKIEFGNKLTLHSEGKFVSFQDARENNEKFLGKLKKALADSK